MPIIHEITTTVCPTTIPSVSGVARVSAEALPGEKILTIRLHGDRHRWDWTPVIVHMTSEAEAQRVARALNEADRSRNAEHEPHAPALIDSPEMGGV